MVKTRFALVLLLLGLFGSAGAVPASADGLWGLSNKAWPIDSSWPGYGAADAYRNNMLSQRGVAVNNGRAFLPLNALDIPDSSPERRWRVYAENLIRDGRFGDKMLVITDCVYPDRNPCPTGTQPSFSTFQSAFLRLVNWANYYADLGGHLRVKYWGAWNEPEFDSELVPGASGDPSLQRRRLELAADYTVAAKEACPACTLVGGEFGSTNPDLVLPFLDRMSQLQAQNRAMPDKWSFHSYNVGVNDGTLPTWTQRYRGKLNERGLLGTASTPKSVWVTEAGVRLDGTSLNGNAANQIAAAQELWRASTLPKASGAPDRIYYYDAVPQTLFGDFDSSLQQQQDNSGFYGLRPAYCGLTNTPAGYCAANAQARGTPGNTGG